MSKYAVISNQFGFICIEESGVGFADAVDICGDIIHESHGGDAWVIDAIKVDSVAGKEVKKTAFSWYGKSGDMFYHAGQ